PRHGGHATGEPDTSMDPLVGDGGLGVGRVPGLPRSARGTCGRARRRPPRAARARHPLPARADGPPPRDARAHDGAPGGLPPRFGARAAGAAPRGDRSVDRDAHPAHLVEGAALPGAAAADAPAARAARPRLPLGGSRRAAGARRVTMPTRVIEVARDHLLDRGLLEFSLRALARDLGMTAPALYRYFPSRTALLEAIAERSFDLLDARLVEALAGFGPHDRLARAAHGYLRFGLDHPRDFALLALL